MLLTKPYGEDPNRWLVFIHVILISYLLLALNTVCDVYFTGAIEVMVDKWQIKADVAGATFMAAGGSAPELFTSLVGATIAQNDVGFGTIIGSAVFNVLFVIGLCGYVAKTPIELTWWPLFRDCSYYVFGLALLAGFASDEKISLVEAVVLFIAYLGYCLIMVFNTRLEALVDRDYQRQRNCASDSCERPQVVIGNWAEPDAVVPASPEAPPPAQVKPPPNAKGELRSPALQDGDGLLGPGSSPPNRDSPAGSVELGPVPRTSRTSRNSKKDEENGVNSQPPERKGLRLSSRTARATALQEAVRDRHEERMNSVSRRSGSESQEVSPAERGGSKQSSGEEPPAVKEEEDEDKDDSKKSAAEDDEPGLMDVPEGWKDFVIWCISLPVYVPIYCLTPQPSERLFLVSFAFSLVWIAGLTFVLVWWVDVLGQALHIDPIVMAFTLLAAGTSIPDAASSVAVTKDGQGDMAVSSSVGSNIFDILVGLPIPWIIKIALHGADYQVTIKSPYLAFDVILLLFMVLAVVLCIHCLGWKLNRMLGLCMAVLYAVFLVIALSVEIGKPDWLMF